MKSLSDENLILNLKTTVIIKKKLLQNSLTYLDKYKKSNCLIIIDNFILLKKSKINYIKKSFKFLKKSEYIANSFSEPTFDNLKEIISNIKNKDPDLIIAIGGGSTIDIGKGLSIALKHKGSLENLQGQDKFNTSTIPVIAIPSIYGSGAEITPSAVFINTKNKIKGGINSKLVQPELALLDPFLAKSNNYKQHVICAFDALVHSIESFHSTIANDFTKSMSIQGSILILQGINLLKKNTETAFEKLAMGSIYSIIALMHSEQNITGASSYQLAIYYGYNHAHCGASFLESSIKTIDEKNSNLHKQLIEELYKNNIIKKKSVKSLIAKLKDIKKEFKISNIRLTDKQISKLVFKIKKMPMLNYSPIKFNNKDIYKFLKNND